LVNDDAPFSISAAPVAEGQREEMMDHLDKLDYAFLGSCVVGFLFCAIAIWRPRPYRQIEAHFQRPRTSELYARGRADKGGHHGQDRLTSVRQVGDR
jgi:hypothetical protein